MMRTLKADQRIPLGIFDRDLTVAGNRTGLIVTTSIVLIAFLAIPIARPFVLETVGVGSTSVGRSGGNTHTPVARQPHRTTKPHSMECCGRCN